MSNEKAALPRFEDVLEAGRRSKEVVHRTPVLNSRRLNQRYGAEIFFKCENFQRMGAFKFRGAYNVIAKLGAERLAGGLVTYSAGNHGQAVALSAHLLGVPCTVVMPKDAPQTKIEATRGYGATVVLYDRYTEDRVRISETLAREQGAVIIPPYDHFDVIAGQGTATQELLDEVGALDALLVPLGGGGLLAGALLAAKAMAPACRVFGVEPQAGNDGQQSLRAGHIVSIDAPQTIADGAQTKYLGQLNFAIIRRDVADIVTATDAQLLVAMRELAATLKLVVEPTGCLGLAALDALGASLRGQRVGVILSGGNVDLATFGAMLQG